MKAWLAAATYADWNNTDPMDDVMVQSEIVLSGSMSDLSSREGIREQIMDREAFRVKV